MRHNHYRVRILLSLPLVLIASLTAVSLPALCQPGEHFESAAAPRSNLGDSAPAPRNGAANFRDRRYAHMIVYGKRASSPERTACEDLKNDLRKTTRQPAIVVEEDGAVDFPGNVYIVGTPESCDLIRHLSESGAIAVTAESPGPQGGWMKTVTLANNKKALVLAGSDAKGAQYAVYDFSHQVLGVDPFSYWTGYEPKTQTQFQPPEMDQRIEPPAVPIICYFDNDNDELANLTRPYLQFDKATWHALIDSLVRVRYNAIDLHDHLGRSEFYRWDFYKELRPGYQTDLQLVNDVIDYAHSKGVKIQIPMYLAWQFRHISEEESRNWTLYKDRWIETWRYYLEETPLGKGDLFLFRPRSPLWDGSYRAAPGEDTATVMTEAFTALRDVVLAHNPKAILLCDLYSNGRFFFYQGGFRPPKDYILLWPDDGYCDFMPLPPDTAGYRFGIYAHAGFWLNHVIQDPYPVHIGQCMRTLIQDDGADEILLVNGQTFRHFLLNLEAFSRAATDPAGFDGEAFYTEWTTRYFGQEASPHAVTAFKKLHEASGRGYVALISMVSEDVEKCQMRNTSPYHRTWFRPTTTIEDSRNQLLDRQNTLLEALDAARKVEAAGADQAHFAYDQLVLPITLFVQTVELDLALKNALLAWTDYTATGAPGDAERADDHMRDAVRILKEHLATRFDGDKNERWKGWYDPAKRRPNGGFPTIEELQAIRFADVAASPVSR